MTSESFHPDRRTVLVVAFSDWEGLSRLPWLLHRAGAVVEVFSQPGSWVSQSSWVARRIEAPPALDDFLEALKALLAGAARPYDWVVAGDDPLLGALADRRHEAWARALLPCRDDDAAIDFLASKIAFLRQCREAGITVADSRICSSTADIATAAGALGFPMVVKAEQGFGGQTLRVLHGPQDIESVDFTPPLIAQAWVEGPVCSAAAFFDHGELAGFYAYRRTRTWGRFGASTAVTFDDFPGLQGMLQSLGALSGFHGLCGIDMILREGSGEIVLLEQNFRPTLTMLLGRRVGADLIPCVRQALFRRPVDRPLMLQDPHCRLMVPLFPSDILRAIDANDLPGVLRWCALPHYWREMHWHDARARAHARRAIARALAQKSRRFWSRLRRLTLARLGLRRLASAVTASRRPGARG